MQYQLHACPHCTIQCWLPLKNPGAHWYEHDGRYADRNADPILKPNQKHLGTLRFLRGRQGKVLDVGCGVGNFLAEAQRQGWEPWGIDFDADGIEAARRTFGLDHLEVADVASFAAAHPEERFDLVAFFDVLEHVDNHNEFIEVITGVLTERGYLAMSMPYRHGWRWLMPHDLPPRHLTRWDKESLERFLERHGFKIVYFRRLPASFSFLVMKMRFNYGKAFSFGLIKKAKESGGKIQGSARGKRAPSSKVRFLHMLARLKDVLLFGIPAGILWLILLPTRKRYTDMYVVAQKI